MRLLVDAISELQHRIAYFTRIVVAGHVSDRYGACEGEELRQVTIGDVDKTIPFSEDSLPGARLAWRRHRTAAVGPGGGVHP
jgi:hypothetical protein